jgi:hypothetical protein
MIINYLSKYPGIDITVYTRNDNIRDPINKLKKEWQNNLGENLPKVKIIYLPTKLFYFPIVSSIILFLMLIKIKPKFFIYVTPLPFTHLIILKILRVLFKIKIINDIIDYYPLYVENQHRQRAHTYFYANYINADIVISSSNRLIKYLLLPLHKKKIYYLPHGGLIIQNTISEKAYDVAFIGSFRHYNEDNITQLFNKGFKILIIGEITSRIEKYSLNNNITIIKWLPYKECIQLIKKAKIGIIPEANEIMWNLFLSPYKFFDYLVNSLFIICPQNTECADILNQLKIPHGEFNPYSKNDLINKILSSLNIEYDINRLINVHMYAWENISKKFLKVLIENMK